MGIYRTRVGGSGVDGESDTNSDSSECYGTRAHVWVVGGSGGVTAGGATKGKPVGEFSPGAAVVLRHPCKRQSRFGERLPKGAFPGAVPAAVHRLGIGQIRENSRRGFGNDTVV